MPLSSAKVDGGCCLVAEANARDRQRLTAKLLRMEGKGRIAQYMKPGIRKGILDDESHKIIELAKFRRIQKGMFM